MSLKLTKCSPVEHAPQVRIVQQNKLGGEANVTLGMTEKHKRELLERVEKEVRARPDFVLPVHMDPHTLMCVVASMQLSLRHPGHRGRSADVVRGVIDAIIARVQAEGFSATAEMLRMGDNPGYDDLARTAEGKEN